MHPLVYVQYIFEKAEHRVTVQGHSNSKKKSTRSYQTSHTTKGRISALCNQGQSPDMAFNESVAEQNGITKIRNAASHPSNVRQVKHIKSTTLEKQPNDHMLEMIEMQKEGVRDAEKAFVQKVERSSDPCIILTMGHLVNYVVKPCKSLRFRHQFHFQVREILCNSYHIPTPLASH